MKQREFKSDDQQDKTRHTISEEFKGGNTCGLLVLLSTGRSIIVEEGMLDKLDVVEHLIMAHKPFYLQEETKEDKIS